MSNEGQAQPAGYETARRWLARAEAARRDGRRVRAWAWLICTRVCIVFVAAARRRSGGEYPR